MDCSTPGFPVFYCLPEFAQIHAHWVTSSITPFSSCLQSFPASGSFPVSLLFTSGGQSIGVSASTSVLPMNTQDWSPLGWTGWISLQSKGLSRVFSNATVQKHWFLGPQPSFVSVAWKTGGGGVLKQDHRGFPWWSSGWESTLQCRVHQFEPWSENIPHTVDT